MAIFWNVMLRCLWISTYISEEPAASFTKDSWGTTFCSNLFHGLEIPFKCTEGQSCLERVKSNRRDACLVFQLAQGVCLLLVCSDFKKLGWWCEVDSAGSEHGQMVWFLNVVMNCQGP